MLATLISGDRIRPGDELDIRAAKVATGLRAKGLGSGDVIAILMRNDFPFVEVGLGAERAGVTAVPLNWHGSVEELLHVLHDSQARVLFAHADLLEKVMAGLPAGCEPIRVPVPPEVAAAYQVPFERTQVPPGMSHYEDWLSTLEPDISAPTLPKFRLLYTSGSTGKPKGVMRLRGSEEITARFGGMARQAHGLEIRPIRAIMTGPLYHSAPNSYAINCVRFGELLVLQPKFDAQELLDLIETHRISHLHMVPTMFSRLLRLPQPRRDSFDTSTLRAVTHGAAMCPPELKKAMIHWWGPVIMEYYAATETGIITGCTSEQWLSHPGSVGIPPEGVEIKIVDDEGRTLGPGEVGEILSRSDIGALVSYRNAPEATEELHRGDWVTMGDIGYRDAAGFLWICDRKKDLIISGGVNVFPAEVEECLGSHPAVKDVIVFGIPDADLGEAVAAVVEVVEHHQATPQSLQAFVTERLGRLRAPSLIQLIDKLPREDTGKLARRKMRARLLESMRGTPE